MLCLKAFWWLTHILIKSRISWKSMPKWTPKVIPKSTFGRSGVRLFRFLAEFWGMRFLIHFRSAKIWQYFAKNWDLNANWASDPAARGPRAEGRRQRRSSWEGFWEGFTRAWHRDPTRLELPSKDGVGGFKG